MRAKNCFPWQNDSHLRETFSYHIQIASPHLSSFHVIYLRIIWHHFTTIHVTTFHITTHRLTSQECFAKHCGRHDWEFPIAAVSNVSSLIRCRRTPQEMSICDMYYYVVVISKPPCIFGKYWLVPRSTPPDVSNLRNFKHFSVPVAFSRIRYNSWLCPCNAFPGIKKCLWFQTCLHLIIPHENLLESMFASS